MVNNNKILAGGLVIAACFLFSAPAFSQTGTKTTEEQLELAKQYQTGFNREANPQKAYQIYSGLASKKSPQALFELGNMYLRGEGTEQDFTAALKCFQEAAALDYTPALCRSALMYQKGAGDIRQDFSKAFELYDLAAKKDDPDGCYGAGYLTYKGFGVKQDYVKALAYFQKGADRNDARCEYMLACHALLGYENNQDIEKGKKYMERAMAHGHKWVEDVINLNMVDSLTRRYKRDPNGWTDVKNGRINHIKRSMTNSATAEQLRGEWKGKLYTYDWSGKKIDSEENIKLSIEANNNRLTVKWFTSDTLRLSANAERAGDEWIAPEGDQYNPSPIPDWYIAHSRYDIDTKGGKEVLYADFQTYNMDMREPWMPQIAVLERIK